MLLGYRLNTSTPTYVAYTGGKYYHGAFNTWNYLTTLPLMKKVHLSLETDENQYGTSWPGEVTTRQWLGTVLIFMGTALVGSTARNTTKYAEESQ